MIELTKLNGGIIFINPHLLESLEPGIETRLLFISGKTLVVKETEQEIIEKIINYRKRLGAVKQEI